MSDKHKWQAWFASSFAGHRGEMAPDKHGVQVHEQLGLVYLCGYKVLLHSMIQFTVFSLVSESFLKNLLSERLAPIVDSKPGIHSALKTSYSHTNLKSIIDKI